MKTLLALAVLLSFVLQDVDPALKKEFEQKKEGIRGGTTDAHSQLGMWCLEKGLKDDARWCFQEAHKLAPDNSDAIDGMKRCGYDLDGKSFRKVTEIAEKRRSALKKDDLDGRFLIAEYLKDFGCEKEAKKLFDDILKADPEHSDTRRVLGFTRCYGDWMTEEQSEVEKRLDGGWQFALDLKKTPEQTLADLKPLGYKGTIDEVRRCFKFFGSPMGTQKNVKLEMAPGDLSKGVYTYGVPDTYLPWRKNPLIIFIHGTQSGDGDGADGFGRIWPRTGPRGYITICPTNLERIMMGWSTEKAEKFLRAIVREFGMKYNVDVDRTYLIGHGMGGYGAWHCGTRMTDIFACISPWAGGGDTAIYANLKYTPTYIIHNKRDKELPVTFSEDADRQLTGLGYYHIFVSPDLEVNTIPQAEQEKVLDWFEKYKRHPRARK